jgi:hypothetical protein
MSQRPEKRNTWMAIFRASKEVPLAWDLGFQGAGERSGKGIRTRAIERLGMHQSLLDQNGYFNGQFHGIGPKDDVLSSR